MIPIREGLFLDDRDVRMKAVGSSGPGGQHVNRTSTAIELRFDIRASSLPDGVKSRMMSLRDRRITRDGVVVILSREERSQDANRQKALARLVALIRSASIPPKRRRPTRPTRGARERRIEGKKHRSRVKSMRGKVSF